MTNVTMIDGPSDPVGTLCRLWDASKTDGPIPDRNKSDMAELFAQLIMDGVPCIQHLNFTFELDDVPIALREQMVRHRVGVKHGDRIGADIVPDVAESTWWAQSMRVLDMGHFRFHTPESIDGRTVHANGLDSAKDLYEWFMDQTRQVYRSLVDAGVPMEDARMVIPLAATHRITWTVNLLALKHIIGKRGCWILQLGLWGDVIRGMVDALCERYGTKIFRRLITPPCITGDTFTGCAFKEDNRRRVDGDDAHLPPCSLYMNNESEAVDHAFNASSTWYIHHTTCKSPCGTKVMLWNSTDDTVQRRYVDMQQAYRALWERDTLTGQPLSSGPTTAPRKEV